MSTKNTISYKGYIAELNLDTDDNIIVGRVINTADLISFHGASVEEAKNAYYNVLDTYLETCQKENINPSLPTSGKFSLRIAPELHRQLRDRASLERSSINEMIIAVLSRSMERYHKRIGN